MDPVSALLAHRLQAVLIKRKFRAGFTKIFRTPQEASNLSRVRPPQIELKNVAADETLDDPDVNYQAHPEHQQPAENTDEEVFHSEVPSDNIHLDDQDLRQTKYVRFRDEEPSDYTQGPARFICGDDGIQPCVALLLTYELSAMMQRMISFQRRYIEEARYAERQIDEIQRFQREVTSEIVNHAARISRAESQDCSDGGADPQLTEKLRNDIPILEQMRADMERREDNVNSTLRLRQEYYIDLQQEIMAVIEEAFLHAGLVGPNDQEEKPIEEFSLQEQYKKTLKEIHDPEPDIIGGYTPEPSELDTSRDYMYNHVPEQTSEEQAETSARHEAATALDRALQQLNTAEYQFEHREESRDEDLQLCIEKEQRGEEIHYKSKEDFDVNWVRNFGEITRNLIDAENAVAEAKKAAKAAGVKYTSAWQNSDYVDEYRPGYPLSQEIDVEQVQQAVMPSVESWLETVEHIDVEVPAEGQENLDSEPVTEITSDLDEWSCQEVEIGDSLSCVDLDWHREQIDEWRRTCRGSE